MTAFIISLIAIAGIIVMWGTFMAIIISVIAGIIFFYFGTYATIAFILLILVLSIVAKIFIK